MAHRMTKEDGIVFRRRWQAVARAERAELRALTPEQRLRQLEALMASVDSMGWSEELAAEEAVVRERWLRLKGVPREEA
ncbi:MAG: hypothetical protein GWP08_09995 [Nitrospiraceae bacterium]|nr:hypothetical protein [Nitrospiraceae bacterium]